MWKKGLAMFLFAILTLAACGNQGSTDSIVTNDNGESTKIVYRVTEEHYEDLEGNISLSIYYEYDEEGKQISETRVFEDSTFQYDVDCIYDSNGNCIEKKLDYDTTIKMTYDENGNCISEEYIESDTYITYEYDDNGICIKQISGFGSDEFVLEYKNTLDKNGNCIVRERYDEEGNLSDVTRYEYQRFELSNNNIDVAENTIEGKWMAITDRPSNMSFHGMHFPAEMEFFSDGSFTEYYSDKNVEGTYVWDSDRLKITEDMSAGVRDRVWIYDTEFNNGYLSLIWEDGTTVEYTRIYE